MGVQQARQKRKIERKEKEKHCDRQDTIKDFSLSRFCSVEERKKKREDLFSALKLLTWTSFPLLLLCYFHSLCYFFSVRTRNIFSAPFIHELLLKEAWTKNSTNKGESTDELSRHAIWRSTKNMKTYIKTKERRTDEGREKIVSCIRDFFTFFKTTLFLLQKQWILFARTIFESKWISRTEVSEVRKELTKWLCSKELYTWIQENVTWVWKKKEGKMSYLVMIIEMRLRFTYVSDICESYRSNYRSSTA